MDIVNRLYGIGITYKLYKPTYGKLQIKVNNLQFVRIDLGVMGGG